MPWKKNGDTQFHFCMLIGFKRATLFLPLLVTALPSLVFITRVPPLHRFLSVACKLGKLDVHYSSAPASFHRDATLNKRGPVGIIMLWEKSGRKISNAQPTFVRNLSSILRNRVTLLLSTV